MATSSSAVFDSSNQSSPAAIVTQHDHQSTTKPFSSIGDPPSPRSPHRSSTEKEHTTNRNRSESSTSTIQSRLRLRSASRTFQESTPPTGMWIATGQIASSIPLLSDIRRGSYGNDGWSGEGQVIERERRASLSRRGSSQTGEEFRRRNSSNPNSPPELLGSEFRHQNVPEAVEEGDVQEIRMIPSGVPLESGFSPKTMPKSNGDIESENRLGKRTSADQRSSRDRNLTPDSAAEKSEAQYRTTPFDNGYQFPPKHSWGESLSIFLKAFWKFFITPIGFLVVTYGLNVVAWGGMLFLLLCNASPAMCTPTCNDINSPRRIWIEIDSQILNALFCVTGFGTIPWRFRDLYYLLQYRIRKEEAGLRRLAGINRGWFRLAGSQHLPVGLGPADMESEVANVPESSIPLPITKISNAPLTGVRAPPTAMWKLDFVIWSMVWNTFLQAILSGFMWGLNRYKRPSWSTGLFVALACIVAAAGGIMSFVEGKRVKGIEGVPVSEKDQETLRRRNELGITHWNNIKDEKPKGKKGKKSQKDSEDVQLAESAV